MKKKKKKERKTGETGRSPDKSSQSVSLRSAEQSRISLTKFLCTSRSRQSGLAATDTYRNKTENLHTYTTSLRNKPEGKKQF